MSVENEGRIWNVIALLADRFDQHSLDYHFDGSTSLFIQGGDIEMDDIDIVFRWDDLECVRELFLPYGDCVMLVSEAHHLRHFRADIQAITVHCLFYNISTGAGFDSDTCEVIHKGARIQVKTVEFYWRNKPQLQQHERIFRSYKRYHTGDNLSDMEEGKVNRQKAQIGNLRKQVDSLFTRISADEKTDDSQLDELDNTLEVQKKTNRGHKTHKDRLKELNKNEDFE